MSTVLMLQLVGTICGVVILLYSPTWLSVKIILLLVLGIHFFHYTLPKIIEHKNIKKESLAVEQIAQGLASAPNMSAVLILQIMGTICGGLIFLFSPLWLSVKFVLLLVLGGLFTKYTLPKLIVHNNNVKKARAQATAQAELEYQRLLAEDAKQRAAELAAKDAALRQNFANRMAIASFHPKPFILGDRVFWNNKWEDTSLLIDFSLSRSLSSMTRREIDILLYSSLLRNHELIPEASANDIDVPILYNSGNCQKTIHREQIDKLYADKHSINGGSAALDHIMKTFDWLNPHKGIVSFLTTFSVVEERHPNHHLIREVRAKLIGGSNWLADNEVNSSPFDGASEGGSLFLGETDSGTRFWYGQEGSLITVAPPGSGKTQCHVFPNLVTYNGPIVILDVKGECYEKTSAWRKANIGPVFKFNPLNPAASSRYNPLALISDNPDTIWEECRLMADLLIVPENSHDPSWENRARDVVAGIIAWMVLHNPQTNRSMSRVMDVVSKVGWDKFVEDAKYTMELPALSRLGNSLAAMPDKQLEGVLDAARRHLAVWEGSRVEKVTASCDWTTDVLRDGSNASIYICIPPNEVESYAPLLRVLFAQHLRHLLKQLPPPGQKPILFMLDELPRLGPMKPVEEALEVGRQYGIKLWMFAQSLGQLEKAYANAEGMIGSCAVRIFMNPSSHDGTAKRLSDELGYVESITDGSRQLMVEPSDLAGPDYAHYQIVIARNTRPVKLKKIFAYNDKEFAPRLTASNHN